MGWSHGYATGPSDRGDGRSARFCRSPRPPTYHDHLAKRADPARRSDRARRDEALRPEIRRVFEENWSVYGVRKVWHQLRREGFDVARCAVARLMKDMDIQGLRHWARTNGASMAQSAASRTRRRSPTRNSRVSIVRRTLSDMARVRSVARLALLLLAFGQATFMFCPWVRRAKRRRLAVLHSSDHAVGSTITRR